MVKNGAQCGWHCGESSKFSTWNVMMLVAHCTAVAGLWWNADWMVLMRLHSLTMAAVGGSAHGNVIVENVEHWSNVIVWTIVLVNFDSMPNVKLDSTPNGCNLFRCKSEKIKEKLVKIRNKKAYRPLHIIDRNHFRTNKFHKCTEEEARE